MRSAAGEEDTPEAMASTACPKVLIVEDEIIVALDLEQTLGRYGFDVAGTVSSGAEAVAMAAAIQPDLVLMDVALAEGSDGIDTAHLICRDRDVPVVFISAFWDERTIDRAADSGAVGYIVKPFQSAQVVTAARMALRRHAERHRSHTEEIAQLDRILHAIDQLARPRDDSGDEPRLSPREAQVVRALVTDRYVTVVAEKLEISLHTARNHLKSVFRKLRVHSQDELVRTLSQWSTTVTH